MIIMTHNDSVIITSRMTYGYNDIWLLLQIR